MKDQSLPGTLHGGFFVEEQRFECAACGGVYAVESGVNECPSCHRSYCPACIQDNGFCYSCQPVSRPFL